MQDIEIWRPVPIKKVAGLYEISSYGIIRSLPRLKHTPHGGTFLSKEKVLTQTLINSGYLSVTLSNKPFNEALLVHILTAIVYVDNPDNLEFVNHEDGIKTNNYYKNLKWCTRSYNMRHAFATGLIPATRNRNVKPSIEIEGLQPN
jgi:hypothetical protein